VDHDQQKQRADTFQKLHTTGETFVLANAWDVSSAVLLEQAGFSAIATTSAGIAFSQGLPDGEQLACDALLSLVKKMADSVSIPVSVDFEAGYADSDEELCNNVLASAECPNVAELNTLNVARVSLGSGPMRAAMAFCADMASSIRQTGSYDAMLARQIPLGEASDLFTG